MAIKIKGARKEGVKHSRPLESAIVKGLRPIYKGQKITWSNSRNLKSYYSIRKILNNISDEECPGELITVFRKYWPSIRTMTMKEAWLRTVYCAAIGGNESAWYFIADRTEGKVQEGNLENGKGMILDAIDKMTEEKTDDKKN